jgi:predicted amidohydrolase YtcJ
MKRLVALDKRKNTKVGLRLSDGKLLLEKCQGSEKATHVLTNSHHDSHTHPVMYSMLFGALDPVMLNESTDRQEILTKLREKAKESGGPIMAYEYKTNAGITANDLDEFKGLVWLVDSSLHGGVANKRLLTEIDKRKKPGMFGGASQRGISEDYNFLAMGIMEEQVQEKGVGELLRWVKARITEGTTSMEEKIIFTEAEWEIFKEAMGKLKDELGYMPVRSVFVHHNLFMKNPKRYALEAEELGIEAGVKWVGDGGLGSKTAALRVWRYADGSKGELTLPIDTQDPKAIQAYIRLLKDNGIERLTCHAIGDRTISLVMGMHAIFREAGLTLSMEHFELPTPSQTIEAACLGIPLSMQLNYSTEVWRYEPWVGTDVQHINPVRSVMGLYHNNGHLDRITFGTDGMPQSMLWAIACGVQHPLEHQRISIHAAMKHSSDPEGLMVLTKSTYNDLKNLDLEKASRNREASAAELHKGVVLVARDSRILHSTL